MYSCTKKMSYTQNILWIFFATELKEINDKLQFQKLGLQTTYSILTLTVTILQECLHISDHSVSSQKTTDTSPDCHT